MSTGSANAKADIRQVLGLGRTSTSARLRWLVVLIVAVVIAAIARSAFTSSGDAVHYRTAEVRRGDLVVADRFSLSTFAYQIGGRELPARSVMSADRLARADLKPDLTLLLNVTSEQSAARRGAKHKPDRIERESAAFFRSVRLGYQRWGQGKPGIVVIDSGLGADAVFERARRLLSGRLRRRAA